MGLFELGAVRLSGERSYILLRGSYHYGIVVEKSHFTRGEGRRPEWFA